MRRIRIKEVNHLVLPDKFSFQTSNAKDFLAESINNYECENSCKEIWHEYSWNEMKNFRQKLTKIW